MYAATATYSQYQSAVPATTPIGCDQQYYMPCYQVMTPSTMTYQNNNIAINNNYNNYYNNNKNICLVDEELSDCEDISPDSMLGKTFSFLIEDLIVFGGDLDESITLLDMDYFAEQAKGIESMAAEEDYGCNTDSSSTRHGSISGSSDGYLLESLMTPFSSPSLVSIPAPLALFGGQGVHIYFESTAACFSAEEIMLFDDEAVIICVNEQQMQQMAYRASSNARVILAHPNKQIVVRRALSCADDHEIIVPYIISEYTAPVHFQAE